MTISQKARTTFSKLTCGVECLRSTASSAVLTPINTSAVETFDEFAYIGTFVFGPAVTM